MKKRPRCDLSRYECAIQRFGAKRNSVNPPKDHLDAIRSGDIINGLSELIYVSLRKLCKERYGTKNYSEFRKAIVQRGYGPFKEDLDLLFRLIEEREVSILPINDDLNEWKSIMIRYNLLPNDALIASTCLKHEISRIATFDGDFLRVDWLKIIGKKQ